MIKNLIPTSMNEKDFLKAITVTPKEILSSNSKLKKDGIHNITMPAFRGAYVVNGIIHEQRTCPNAGTCKAFCYASSGTYGFNNTMIKHSRNLNYFMNHPFDFADQLIEEIQSKRNLRAIRWHDSGDIMSEGYWGFMTMVMNALPHVQFYAYTKMVSFIKSRSDIPANFTYIFSFGGQEDNLIDIDHDRHAKVFDSRRALRKAGYSDGTHTDRLATNPKFKKLGLVVHGNWLAMPKMRKMVKRLNAVG